MGMLRDPRASCDGAPSDAFAPKMEGEFFFQVDTRMWVLLDPALAGVAALGAPKARSARRQPKTARALLFDMGGSMWSTEQGSRWITRQFSRSGIHFEHAYVWEAAPTTSANYYKGATADALSRIHFFNWPVTDGVADVANNPFALIKLLATPEDFVVVKLDIDTPKLERALVQQLLEDQALHALVDEFFFEHHVAIKDFDHWAKGIEGTLIDTYAIFGALRDVGVHAHSWP